VTRGRLLFSFQAELYRWDPLGTRATVPDGSTASSGYDDDFKEPVLADSDGDGIADNRRVEMPSIRIPCQVETGRDEALRMTDGGNVPDSMLVLIFHFADLERMGLVDTATKRPLLKNGDRLAALYDRTGMLVEKMPGEGLYATEVRSLGFGLGLRRSYRNLLLARFEDRPGGF
jgi:hypothetical protein